jgi:monoamine oxidase
MERLRGRVLTKRVAIIGGGPGGLMTAYLIEKRANVACDITLLEAGSRLGGKIVTNQFDSAPVRYEAGAAELYDYSSLGADPLRELIAELGLSIRQLNGQTVVWEDCILKTQADIRRAFGDETVRALREFNRHARTAITPAEYYDSDWRADNEDALSRQSFRELLAKVPDERARRYVEVAVHSDLATEPHLTNATYGLQNYLMNEPDYMRLYTIDGGIESLPRALAKRIKARVLLNHRVMSVERTPQDRYWVRSRYHGEIRSDEFDYVVVALPNNWIPGVAWEGAALTDAMRRHHEFYDRPAHYLRVSILFDKPFWRDQVAESYFMLDAFGGCCVYDESPSNESPHNGATPYGVLGWLLAGEAALTMSNYADEALVDAMLETLPRCMSDGWRYRREARVHRWVGTVNGLPGGVPSREPESRHQSEPTHHGGLFVVGDYLFDSTINGVLDSADIVADWVLKDIEESPAESVDYPAAAIGRVAG